jgi:acetyl esterase
MALDPVIQAEIDNFQMAAGMEPPPLPILRDLIVTLTDGGLRESGYEPPEVATITDHKVAVEGGEIDVRVFTPIGSAPFPAFVNYHGGAFRLGTIHAKLNDAMCQYWAAGAGCVVVTVEYRLAPEHKFPTAPNDCYAALVWVAEHAGELGVDAARIAVGGQSAGGNLATVVTLMARDLGGPSIVHQVLEIPAPDMVGVLDYPSATEFGTGYIITSDMVEEINGDYFSSPDDARNPYASPILADLTGLPPAHVMTAELDLVRDAGEAYAQRLRDAGVPTTSHRYDGHIHGSSNLFYRWEPARDWMDEIVDVLKQAFGT